MEQNFNSLSIFDFKDRFQSKEDCLTYLSDLKWGNGFECKKCGHGHSCAGAAAMSRQCTSCRYVEPPTAGTLFHQVKFDLVKAFWIVYARVIPKASAEHLGGFMKYHIDENAQITTDKWTGYTPLKKEFGNLI